MKKKFYKSLYTLLTHLTNRFENQYLIRYKILIGTLVICMHGNSQDTKQVTFSPEKTKQPSQETDSVFVEGIVVDESGEPVIGANICAKDHLHGVISDLHGKFKLKVPAETKEISVSFLGLVPVTVQMEPVIKVTMQADTNIVDCYIMVTGYSSEYDPKKKLNQSPDSMRVEGIILDAATRQPLAGVTIIAKNTTIGTISDENGKFTLTFPKKIKKKEIKKIKISYVGCIPQELTPSSNMEILLEEDNTPMCYEVPVRSYKTR